MSKGLNVLKRLIRNNIFILLERTRGKKQFANDINIIEKELKRLEELEIMYSNCAIELAKQKKVLEIIKEKRVDVKDLMDEFEWTDGLKSYNERTNHIPLIEQEFKLLKETLKDE